MPVHFNYDPESDAAYLKLLEGEQGRSADQRTLNIAGRGEIVLDFNLEGHLVGVEVLGARSLLPPDLLDKGAAH
jgi:uncharacterized protein YuzE